MLAPVSSAAHNIAMEKEVGNPKKKGGKLTRRAQSTCRNARAWAEGEGPEGKREGRGSLKFCPSQRHGKRKKWGRIGGRRGWRRERETIQGEEKELDTLSTFRYQIHRGEKGEDCLRKGDNIYLTVT